MPCTFFELRTVTVPPALSYSTLSADTAGRVMSRRKAKKAARGRAIAIAIELDHRGIHVRSAGKGTLDEEMPEAYKDVEDVVEAVHRSGISRKVARLVPLAVIKG